MHSFIAKHGKLIECTNAKSYHQIEPYARRLAFCFIQIFRQIHAERSLLAHYTFFLFIVFNLNCTDLVVMMFGRWFYVFHFSWFSITTFHIFLSLFFVSLSFARAARTYHVQQICIHFGFWLPLFWPVPSQNTHAKQKYMYLCTKFDGNTDSVGLLTFIFRFRIGRRAKPYVWIFVCECVFDEKLVARVSTALWFAHLHFACDFPQQSNVYIRLCVYRNNYN